MNRIATPMTTTAAEGLPRRCFTVAERFLSQGMTLPRGTPEEFAAFIAAESIRWGDIVRKTGIRMD